MTTGSHSCVLSSVQVASCLGSSCEISIPHPSSPLPGFVQMPTTQAGPDSTVRFRTCTFTLERAEAQTHAHPRLCTHSHPHTAHTCTHSSLQAGRRQARVCLETQGWELMSPEEPTREPSLSSMGSGGWHIWLHPVPRYPCFFFSLQDPWSCISSSQGPRAQRPHPTKPGCAHPHTQFGLLWRGRGVCSERRRQWSLSQLL